MPKRKTIRGAARTPLSRDAGENICGASFAGLSVARERAGAGARGGRRMRAGAGYLPPVAPLSRGREVHPHGAGSDLEVWIDRRYVPAGYGWSFPARDEVRVGVGSFDPRFHVKDTTVLLAEDLE